MRSSPGWIQAAVTASLMAASSSAISRQILSSSRSMISAILPSLAIHQQEFRRRSYEARSPLSPRRHSRLHGFAGLVHAPDIHPIEDMRRDELLLESRDQMQIGGFDLLLRRQSGFLR